MSEIALTVLQEWFFLRFRASFRKCFAVAQDVINTFLIDQEYSTPPFPDPELRGLVSSISICFNYFCSMFSYKTKYLASEALKNRNIAISFLVWNITSPGTWFDTVKPIWVKITFTFIPSMGYAKVHIYCWFRERSRQD